MKRKEIFLLFILVFGVIGSLLFLRFYSFNEFHLRDRLTKYSLFALAATNNVDLDVNINATPPTPTPSGSVSPSGPTPSSFTHSPGPSESFAPSESIGPSFSPSASGGPQPTTSPGGGTIEKIFHGLSTFSSLAAPYNLILALLLFLGPTLAALLTSIIDPFASIPVYLYYLWLLLLQMLGIKKKGKEWGVVYDYVSKKPVALAVVRIINRTTREVKDSSVTTKTGAFAFLAREGDYVIKVLKSGYRFPLPELALGDGFPWVPGKSDGNYQNIYTGGFITIKREDEGTINCNIPLEYTGESTYTRWFEGDNIIFVLKQIFALIRTPLLILGSFIAIVALIARFNVLNLIVIGVYIILWGSLIYHNYFKTRAHGRIIDDLDNEPISLVIVRLIKVDELSRARVLETKVTDNKGRFMMLAPQGRYYIMAMKPSYTLYRSQIFSIKDERLIDFDLHLKRMG